MPRPVTATLSAIALVTATLATAACRPGPAHARHLGNAPMAVAWGAAGAWIAVTEGAAPKLRLLSPDLHAHTLETPWRADPGDGSVPFGESVAATVEAGDPLFAAGGFFPSYLGDSGEGRITIWNGTGKAIREIRAPAIVALGRLQFLPGRRLAALVHVPVPGRASDHHGAVYVWDLASGEGPSPWLFPRVGAVRDVDFDAAGRRVALLAADAPYVSDVSSSGVSTPRPLPLGARPGEAIALSPDGATLAAARDGGVAIFGGHGPRRSLPGAPSGIASLRFAPAGATRLGVLAEDRRFRVYDLGSGKTRLVARDARAFAWRPDGTAVAVLIGHGRLAVYATP